jgi:hypothetical protein
MGTVASYVISVGAVSADDEATLAIFLFGFVFFIQKIAFIFTKKKNIRVANETTGSLFSKTATYLFCGLGKEVL